MGAVIGWLLVACVPLSNIDPNAGTKPSADTNAEDTARRPSLAFSLFSGDTDTKDPTDTGSKDTGDTGDPGTDPEILFAVSDTTCSAPNDYTSEGGFFSALSVDTDTELAGIEAYGRLSGEGTAAIFGEDDALLATGTPTPFSSSSDSAAATLLPISYALRSGETYKIGYLASERSMFFLCDEPVAEQNGIVHTGRWDVARIDKHGTPALYNGGSGAFLIYQTLLGTQDSQGHVDTGTVGVDNLSVLKSYEPTDSTYEHALSQQVRVATAFSTGREATTLDTVRFVAAGYNPTPLGGVYSDDGGQPGEALETLAYRDSWGAGWSIPRMTSSQTLVLSAETTYWVVVYGSGAYQGVAATPETEEVARRGWHLAETRLVSEDGGGSWSSHSGPLHLKIDLLDSDGDGQADVHK